jgi:hypothetical protein
MKDFLGQELSIGDLVVLVIPGYRDFAIGKILRFTKCYAFVNFPKPWQGAAVGGEGEFKQYPSQLIRITEEQAKRGG